MSARLVEGALILEQEIAEPHVGVEADTAARVALDDRLPDLDCLVGLIGLEAQVAGIEEFARGAVFDNRAAHRWLFAILLRVEQREGEKQEEIEGEQEADHVANLALGMGLRQVRKPGSPRT